MCLDVCGLAANLYRRNTPVIKVLTKPAHMPAFLPVRGRSFVYDCDSAVPYARVSASSPGCSTVWVGMIAEIATLVMSHGCHATICLQVPTTLMAAIDASIGIKTAVNFENRKNKLGTYSPPLGVFIDR